MLRWPSLVRFVIYAVAWILVPVLTALVVLPIEAPLRAFAIYLDTNFGLAGTGGFLVLFIGGAFTFWLWTVRREERLQLAQTGILEQSRPAIVREGLGRNLAILLTPIALVALVALALWLTGTPLPAAAVR